MALINVNGLGVISATIAMPRHGAWVADLIVDAQAQVDGACQLDMLGGLTLKGTATRTGVWQDTAYVRVTAGADGLRKLATPKHYRSTTARIVLLDLLRTAGEMLSPTADSKTTSLSLQAWTTIAQPIGNAISALLGDARLVDNAWRVLPDGTLWVGAETWPAADLTNVADYQELARLPHEGRSDLGFNAPALLPGTTLAGRKVSYVEQVLRDDSVRTAAWYED